jgi:hypothetical protein
VGVPADARAGRLPGPPTPLGFGALLKLLPGAASGRPVLRPVEPAARRGAGRAPEATAAAPARGGTGKGEAAVRRANLEAERAARDEARRDAVQARRRRAALAQALRDAKAAERARATALTGARDALARAEREEGRRQAALEEQRFEVKRLAAEAAEQQKQAEAAARARLTIETELAGLRKK